MKDYKLTFEDKQGNEIATGKVTAFNLKEACLMRDEIRATTTINDLHKIKVKLI